MRQNKNYVADFFFQKQRNRILFSRQNSVSVVKSPLVKPQNRKNLFWSQIFCFGLFFLFLCFGNSPGTFARTPLHHWDGGMRPASPFFFPFAKFDSEVDFRVSSRQKAEKEGNQGRWAPACARRYLLAATRCGLLTAEIVSRNRLSITPCG